MTENDKGRSQTIAFGRLIAITGVCAVSGLS